MNWQEIAIIKILMFICEILAKASNDENVYVHQIAELKNELLKER